MRVCIALLAYWPSVLMASSWLEIQPALITTEQYQAQQIGLSEVYVTQLEPLKDKPAFLIMSTEVSCRQFLAAELSIKQVRLQTIQRRCFDYPDEPVIGLSFIEANLYCEQIGGQLPSEQQWMSAALYKQNKSFYHAFIERYFTGDEKLDYLLDVQDAPALSSGLKGMIGNVWEMTRTPWPNSINSYVMKGGAFDLAAQPVLLNPWFRASYSAKDITNINIGFRCIK